MTHNSGHSVKIKTSKNNPKTKGQVALEFLLLTTFGVFFMFVLLIILNKISTDNNELQKNEALQDLGTSVKNELSVASEMDYGYHRNLALPQKIKGQTYNLTIENGSSGNSYLIVESGDLEFLYQIPVSSGTLAPGDNIIIKQEIVTVSHIS